MTPSGAANSGFVGRRASVECATCSRRAALGAIVGTLLSSSAACYGFSGGGGLPKNLKTVAIQPFDNQTATPELQRELLDELRKTLRDRLNLREAPEARADIVVRGAIVKYDVDIPTGASADSRQQTSNRRRLQIVLDVEILDQKTGRTLLKKSGLSREGQYAEGGETVGRRNAIESIMADIVDGVQSQW
jgi:hypothetical protein